MIFTCNCKRCNAEFNTACYEFIHHNGEMVAAHTIKEHRRKRSSYLCDHCYERMKPDPIFDILFKLEENETELYKIIQDLKDVYEDKMEKTPVRIEALATQKIENTKIQFGFLINDKTDEKPKSIN